MALPTVFEKLQLADEKNLLIQGLPSSIEKQFSKISFAKSVTPLLRSRKIDFALVFAINKKQLGEILNDVIPALSANAKFWVSYPKVASKIVSDLSKECQWDCLCQYGFDTVEQVDLDSVWTAMSFQPSLKNANASKTKVNGVKLAAPVTKTKVVAAVV